MMKLSDELKQSLKINGFNKSLIEKVIALEEQIESLKNCCNCKHYIFENNESHCYYRDTDKRGHCNSGNDFKLWEMPTPEG